MDKLLVTPSEVNEKAKEVTNIKETMLTHLDSIKTSWSGKISSCFVSVGSSMCLSSSSTAF